MARISRRCRDSSMLCTMRRASRREVRSMYSVPAAVASVPISGQPLTSDLEMKRQCRAACSTGMSSQEIWLLTMSMGPWRGGSPWRSEEHTSELQSQSNLVCRLLLEKKKKTELQPTLRTPCDRSTHVHASSQAP